MSYYRPLSRKVFPAPDLEPILLAATRAVEMSLRFNGLPTEELLRAVLASELPGRLAVVSSFGTESAVLLHLVAGIDPNVPVIFLNTGKLFGETLSYREALVERLGLTDVRDIRPDPADLSAEDPQGLLCLNDTERCCFLRKVLPLQRALAGFDSWISGRKAFQSDGRRNLPPIERDGAHTKINPLANWSKAALDGYFARHDLPRHPLEADGFLSVGCMPCTDRVAPGEDARAGRWRGAAKSECGIHR
tara:strand:- start:96 stop:839 length:744 start_codon:yes stop_codon:yes gene_type:complete